MHDAVEEECKEGMRESDEVINQRGSFVSRKLLHERRGDARARLAFVLQILLHGNSERIQ